MKVFPVFQRTVAVDTPIDGKGRVVTQCYLLDDKKQILSYGASIKCIKDKDEPKVGKHLAFERAKKALVNHEIIESRLLGGEEIAYPTTALDVIISPKVWKYILSMDITKRKGTDLETGLVDLSVSATSAPAASLAEHVPASTPE